MPNIDEPMMDDIFANFARQATSERTRTKLANLHHTCKKLALSDVKLTVQGVIRQYAADFSTPGESMSESSIRNKLGGVNLYNQLYVAWDRAAKAQGRTKARSGESILPDELAHIQPESLRHRIGLMMAEAHSLRSQIHILERVRDDQWIRVEGRADVAVAQPTSDCRLDEMDLDAVRDFVDPRKLAARGLAIQPDGGLTIATSAGVHRIADPGLINALKRLVKDRR